ncbi:MAG: 50S ribosome-binding GTPase [Candidatus Hydrogenedentes bacterium]|nr:50S ribosome-binding GTPase [Candidatus Hydrogenedentota bacterium]
MQERIGEALTGFAAAAKALRQQLSIDPELCAQVFANAEEWEDLLTYKLVPHLAGEGCLVVAVAGGTNTGKSTVFNLLLGRDCSPVRSTAAATCRPLLAANKRRYEECLSGKLVPEFTPRRLDEPESLVQRDSPESTLFVVREDRLPDRIVILDTPDVDSIDRQNWDVAEHLRAAGDVLVAVVTGEKYKDDRVVQFFRNAHGSGRLILPLMNKANPEDDYEIARAQLEDFRRDVGVGETACFVVPHDFSLAKRFDEAIRNLDGTTTLWEHLELLDVPAIKERVYRDSVERFAAHAEDFLDRIEAAAAGLRQVVREFEGRTHQYSHQYEPAPGRAVGGLFHEFIQSKRGIVSYAIGATSRTVARGLDAATRTVTSAFRRRTELERKDLRQTEDDLRRYHEGNIEKLVRELTTSLIETANNLKEPASSVVLAELEHIDVDAAAKAIVKQTLRAEKISEDFRAHAKQQLDKWWNEHRGTRQALIAFDTLLAATPLAIAVPLTFYTGGWGVAETMFASGTIIEQFFARVIEYQFGDRLFNLLKPWQEEQRQHLERAMREHLTGPALRGLNARLAPLESDTITELKQWQEQCRIIS